MFSKPDKPQGAEGASRRSAATAAASFIAETVTLTGNLTTEGDVQLDGVVVGDVRAGQLTVGEAGRVEGAIAADSVEVRGQVAGAIKARSVKLYATARVDGDITHAQLAIEAGARFQGRSIQADPAAGLAVVAEAAE